MMWFIVKYIVGAMGIAYILYIKNMPMIAYEGAINWLSLLLALVFNISWINLWDAIHNEWIHRNDPKVEEDV